MADTLTLDPSLSQEEKDLRLALALQHLRMEHLSQTVETNTAEDYQKLSQDFGDHIIEYLSEDTNEVIRIHSIL